jgi:hypothetical protein
VCDSRDRWSKRKSPKNAADVRRTLLLKQNQFFVLFCVKALEFEADCNEDLQAGVKESPGKKCFGGAATPRFCSTLIRQAKDSDKEGRSKGRITSLGPLGKKERWCTINDALLKYE